MQLQKGAPQGWHGRAMISTKIEALSPVSHGPYQDRFVGAKIIAGIGFG